MGSHHLRCLVFQHNYGRTTLACTKPRQHCTLFSLTCVVHEQQSDSQAQTWEAPKVQAKFRDSEYWKPNLVAVCASPEAMSH